MLTEIYPESTTGLLVLHEYVVLIMQHLLNAMGELPQLSCAPKVLQPTCRATPIPGLCQNAGSMETLDTNSSAQFGLPTIKSLMMLRIAKPLQEYGNHCMNGSLLPVPYSFTRSDASEKMVFIMRLMSHW